jgi:hypothetical protein
VVHSDNATEPAVHPALDLHRRLHALEGAVGLHAVDGAERGDADLGW